MKKKKILIAPDKFKGSLSSMEVCTAIAEGLQEQETSFEILAHPMADGGDGSLEVIDQHLNLTKQTIEVSDPLGRPILSFYFTASNVAFIELAKASGLVLLKETELNPLKTSTFGTGQMIVDAIAKGCDEIYLFLGGSATNDGGMGIAKALGVSFYDEDQVALKTRGEDLPKVKSLRVQPTFDIEKVKFTLLCDVNNPLYGPEGAAVVYGPQKGASVEIVQLLDAGLKNLNDVLLNYSGVDVSSFPGSGAAGGIAATLVSIFKAEIKSGIESFATLTQLESQIQQVDLVISGEGRLDQQSLQGKVIDGIAKLCKKHNKPFFLFVGKNELSKKEQEILSIKKIFAVADIANGLEDAMQNASTYLQELALDFSNTIID